MGNMDETYRRFSSFTKEDLRRMQVLQNKVLRMKCKNYDLKTPTADLLKLCGDLSVQQLGVFHTLLQVYKTINNGKPGYLAERLTLRRPEEDRVFPQRHVNILQVRGGLAMSGSDFP